MTPGGGLVHLSSFQISYLLGWENKSKGGRAHGRGRKFVTDRKYHASNFLVGFLFEDLSYQIMTRIFLRFFFPITAFDFGSEFLIVVK